jgi:two-component system sensor histidine kinase BarA
VVLLNAGSLETRSLQPVAWWLRQVYARGATPVLILETVSQRQEAYYREQGAICISPPLRSETLKAALRIAQAAEPPPEGAQDAANAPEPLFHDRHFLVADDNEINRMLLRAQLLKLGAEVDDARDGGEALEMLQIQPYDLVFLDLQMPVLHGLEVMEALKKEAGPNTHTPVIAITAHAQPEQRQSVIDRGFAECLIKPILERQVVETASDILKFPADIPADAATVGTDSSRYSATLLSRSQGRHGLALEVARKLFEELPMQLATIEHALERREQDEAARITHKVHGSASFCGLEELRRAAKGLESKLLEPKPWDGCDAVFQGVKDEIGKLLAQQTEILKELETGMETS